VIKEITPLEHIDATLTLPGSKSYTHRALIAAALAEGTSTLCNALKAEDTELTAQALAAMGAGIDWQDSTLRVRGTGGQPVAIEEPIFMGNSGTSLRFLTAVATLGQGKYRLTGSPRLCERPMGELIAALKQLGGQVESVHGRGFPPVTVTGGITGGRARLSGAVSSQFLSALLLIGPLTPLGVEIEITGELVSRPYVNLTLDVQAAFGISHFRHGYRYFQIPGGQQYQCREYDIDGDASSASYFWAAAALTGGRVAVANLNMETSQGDVDFVTVLAQMGCRISSTQEGLAVEGAPLKGIRVDMSAMPDMVPTLAVVAAFAQGETIITGVSHLRYKESDRLAAVAAELAKMGVHVQETEDGLRILGGEPHGAEIDTYGDHRIAMSFAVAGLKIPGIMIKDPDCVKKSFPGFWEYLDQMRGQPTTPRSP
jgi:3-phosphoshikimate 1-carboxyvinyltransferase